MNCIVRTADDVLFNFDDEVELVEEEDTFQQLNEKFGNLFSVDYLWRSISSKDYKKYYILRDVDSEVSLFKMKETKTNINLCSSDFFLQFYFYVVNNKKAGKKYVKNMRAGRLNIHHILQLAYSNKTFSSKIEYIRVSENRNSKYKKYARHWELKYIEREYANDDELAKLLDTCTDIFDPTLNFSFERII
jgi:hypothetical protein